LSRLTYQLYVVYLTTVSNADCVSSMVGC